MLNAIQLGFLGLGFRASLTEQEDTRDGRDYILNAADPDLSVFRRC